MPSRNLAARAGRWSAQHRRTAILGWILFVVLATVLGGMVGQKNIDPSASGNGESKRGDMIVDAAGYPDQTGEQVLIQGKGAVTARDPQVTAAVKDVVERLGTTKGVTDVKSPLNAQDRANTVSEDGRSVV
jgi:RND superfamily putative drug exporter